MVEGGVGKHMFHTHIRHVRWTRPNSNMEELFIDARSFNQPLNNWDVRTEMLYMFSGATSFNQPLHAPWYS